jgi:hypothetical protein
MKSFISSAHSPNALVVFCLLAASSALAGGPSSAPPPWPCTFTLGDAVGDKILSDGGGAYVNGVGGVSCTVTQDAGSAHYQWLWVNFASTASRYVVYPGQSGVFGGSYAGFNNRGTYEVKELGSFNFDPLHPDKVDVYAFRAYASSPAFRQGRFRGNSNFDTNVPGGTSSVMVQAIDNCTWKIWLDSYAPLITTSRGELSTTGANPRYMELMTGSTYNTLVGQFTMPHSAIIHLTGGKPGCL